MVKSLALEVSELLYVCIVYEKFGVWIKAIPKLFHSLNSQPVKEWRMAEPLQIEIGIPNN